VELRCSPSDARPRPCRPRVPRCAAEHFLAHGDCLMQAVRTVFNIAIGAESADIKNTARSALLQMVNTVLKRVGQQILVGGCWGRPEGVVGWLARGCGVRAVAAIAARLGASGASGRWRGTQLRCAVSTHGTCRAPTARRCPAPLAPCSGPLLALAAWAAAAWATCTVLQQQQPPWQPCRLSVLLEEAAPGAAAQVAPQLPPQWLVEAALLPA